MCRHVTRQLAPEPLSARTARELLRECLTEWGLESMLADAQLAASELVTNAVQHAGPPLSLSVSLENGMVEIAVFDGTQSMPSPRPHRDDLVADLDRASAAEAGLGGLLDDRDPRLDVGAAGSVAGGRGLLLVDALVSEWGVSPLSDGKAIWLRAAVPAGAATGPQCPRSGSAQVTALASSPQVTHKD